MAAIIVRNPNPMTLEEELYQPMGWFDELEDFASDVWESWPTIETNFMPLDMYEQKDDLVIRLELAGVKKENVDITLEGDCLTIKAEKKAEELPKDSTTYTCERDFGTYTRSVCLPFPVSADKISATFENGVLEIKLPKTEEAKPKHIEVNVK